MNNLKNKLIYNSTQKDFEFYDLINDPEEREDLYKENSPMIEKLKISLFQVLFYEKLGPKAQEKELDLETIEQLRSLGYIK